MTLTYVLQGVMQPKMEDVEHLASKYNAPLAHDGNIAIISLCSLEITVVIHGSYPLVAPIVSCGNTQFCGGWNADIRSSKERLFALFNSICLIKHGGTKDAVVAYGNAPDMCFSSCPHLAKTAGWRPYITDELCVHSKLRGELVKRSKDITAGTESTSIAIFGLGSVGSVVAELLTRNGAERLTLVDIDRVEVHNIGRASYTLQDVGRPKTLSLARRLLNINPFVDLELYEDDITKVPGMFVDIIRNVDIVVVATDSNEANGNVSRISYSLNKHAVFIGLYDNCKGGEVLVTNNVDGFRTPCYACCTGRGTASYSADTPGLVYGIPGERLQGVTALSADIVTVTSLAVKIVTSLSVLHSGKEQTGLSAELKDFAVYMVATCLTYVRISMADEQLIHMITDGKRRERQHGLDNVHEYSYKYIWTNPSRMCDVIEQRERCNICGPCPKPLDEYDWESVTLDDINKAIPL